jgi:hypothetical protein
VSQNETARETGLAPLVSPGDFVGLPGRCHLAAAGETPMLASQAAVFSDFMYDKGRGMAGRERIYAKVSRTADSLAALLGCQAAELGLPQNVAQAMNMVARSLDRKDGNVVLPQWEYPSVLYPWVTGTNLEVRLVRSPDHLMDARLAAVRDTSVTPVRDGRRFELGNPAALCVQISEPASTTCGPRESTASSVMSGPSPTCCGLNSRPSACACSRPLTRIGAWESSRSRSGTRPAGGADWKPAGSLPGPATSGSGSRRTCTTGWRTSARPSMLWRPCGTPAATGSHEAALGGDGGTPGSAARAGN